MWPRLSQANSGAGNASRKIRTNAKALCAVFIVFSRHEDVPCRLRGGRRQDIAIRPLVRQAVSHNGAKNPRGSMRTTKAMQQRQALSGHPPARGNKRSHFFVGCIVKENLLLSSTP